MSFHPSSGQSGLEHGGGRLDNELVHTRTCNEDNLKAQHMWRPRSRPCPPPSSPATCVPVATESAQSRHINPRPLGHAHPTAPPASRTSPWKRRISDGGCPLVRAALNGRRKPNCHRFSTPTRARIARALHPRLSAVACMRERLRPKPVDGRDTLARVCTFRATTTTSRGAPCAQNVATSFFPFANARAKQTMNHILTRGVPANGACLMR